MMPEVAIRQERCVYPSRKTDQRPISLSVSSAGISSADAPQPGAVEGTVFGAYVLEACIQQDPMGRVYRAEHQGLKRRFALKMLDAACSSVVDLRQFIEQGRAASSVRHPAIINVYDAGIHEGAAYVVTDLVEGVSLRDLIAKRGPLDEAGIVDIAVPLASALVAVHEAGLVHDDLTPANVYLSEAGADQIRARMVDVANSKIWRARSSASGVSAVVSPVYTAPEVARGGPEGPLSDQYRLGVLMYECASGVNPFALDDPRAALRRIMTGEVEPLSSRKPLLSKPLIALIERSMHVDPARRFPSMLELGHELSAAAGHRTRITWGLGSREVSVEHGDVALPPPHFDPLPSPRRAHRRAASHGALAALALVAGLALWNLDAIVGRWRETLRETSALIPSPDIVVLEPRPTMPAPAGTGEPIRRSVANEGAAAPRETPGALAVMAMPNSQPPPPTRARSAPARGAPATRGGARSPRPMPIRPASEHPAPDAAPDWMITSDSPSPQPVFQRGTNEALILD
jgi:eukaryotic-like serine/threonine-protein kinase